MTKLIRLKGHLKAVRGQFNSSPRVNSGLIDDLAAFSVVRCESFFPLPMPDWIKLSKRYRGKWIAMKPDHKTVAGSGDSFDAALADAKKNGCDEPFLAHIPKTPRYFAGGIR